MTCIVGIIEKDEVWIGADSAGVAGLDITIRKDPKVFHVGDFLIGCTSSFRMIQLLRFKFKPPLRGPKVDVYEYMCTTFIDEIRSVFEKGGFMKKNNNEEAGGSFLVGAKGRLFKIGSDFQVGESIVPFNAVGCGEDYAKGALHALCKFDFSIKEQMSYALEAAEKFSAGVARPFIIKQLK